MRYSLVLGGTGSVWSGTRQTTRITTKKKVQSAYEGSLGTILVLHGDIKSFTMDGSKDRINQKYMMKR